MATQVPMVRAGDGAVKKGYTGFSWTTLFFGALPALFRGHFVGFLVQVILAVLTGGLAWLVFPFTYNSWHRGWLAKKGFFPAHAQGMAASGSVAMADSAAASQSNNQNIINVHLGDLANVQAQQPAIEAAPASRPELAHQPQPGISHHTPSDQAKTVAGPKG